MSNNLLPFIIFISGVFLSMIITERANKQLDQEKKANLISLFSKQRLYTFGFLIPLLIVFFFNTQYHFINQLAGLGLYILVILCWIVFSNYKAYQILKANDYPQTYIRSHLTSTTVRVLSMIVFFILMLY